MNIGFVSTRFAGTDGVSLEARKWTTIFENQGHDIYFCAGQLDRDLRGLLIPEMHFDHPDVQRIHDEAFGTTVEPADLRERIEKLAGYLYTCIQRFVTGFDIDVLVAENVLTIPMNIPLGVALARFIEERAFPTIAHHHDFYWERERFAINCVSDILDSAFPPAYPSIKHVVINSLAQKSLRRQRQLESVVVPNIFDFSRAAPGINAFNRDLRGELGLTLDHLFILQPTRVIRRKGIELSIELVRRLRDPKYAPRLMNKEPVLVITHHAGDEGRDYLEELHEKARSVDVPLMFAATRFGTKPGYNGIQKVYSLWDAYIHADFVTYPSLYEGFGNALLEAIYFRVPLLVNRYSVYVADIAPLGLEVVEIEHEITDETIEAVLEHMMDPVRRHRYVEYNYELAKYHFSYEAVAPILGDLLRAS
jgi:glycosyltransferase involved in cell wall biosynthesis